MPFTDQQALLFDSYYKKLETLADHSKIVQVTDLMLNLLVEGGEAEIKYIHVKNMAVHRDNRGGSFMQPTKVYMKGSKILGVGFSLRKCDHTRAVAFQKDPHNKRWLEKFLKTTSSTPFLANFDAATIEGGSVGCGHLNQFLAATVDQCEVPPQFRNNEDLFGKGGSGMHLDSGDIVKRDGNDLGKTLEIGLKWTFIHSNIEQKYPKLPGFLQKALNVEHHIGEGYPSLRSK